MSPSLPACLNNAIWLAIFPDCCKDQQEGTATSQFGSSSAWMVISRTALSDYQEGVVTTSLFGSSSARWATFSDCCKRLFLRGSHYQPVSFLLFLAGRFLRLLHEIIRKRQLLPACLVPLLPCWPFSQTAERDYLEGTATTSLFGCRLAGGGSHNQPFWFLFCHAGHFPRLLYEIIRNWQQLPAFLVLILPCSPFSQTAA